MVIRSASWKPCLFLVFQAISCLQSLNKIRLQPDGCQVHYGKVCCGCCRILKGFGSDICLW